MSADHLRGVLKRLLQVTQDEAESKGVGSSLTVIIIFASGLLLCLCLLRKRDKARKREASLRARHHRQSGPPILSPAARMRIGSRSGGGVAGPRAGGAVAVLDAIESQRTPSIRPFGSQFTIKRQMSSRSMPRLQPPGGAAAAAGNPAGPPPAPPPGRGRRPSVTSGTTRIPGETPAERKRRLSMLRTCSGLTTFGEGEQLVSVGLPDDQGTAERAARLNSFFGHAHIGVAPQPKDLKDGP